MDFQSLQDLVNKHIDLIEINRDAILESKERSAKFLVVQAHLANHLKVLEDVKVKASTIEKASYAQAMVNAGGKNVTENKIQAEADSDYCKSRESVELVDSEINWTKRHYEIFENAHIMFRQISQQI